MMRYLPVAILLFAHASAQVRDLATTDDGRTVFFSANYRPPGIAPPPYRNTLLDTSILKYTGGTWSFVDNSRGGNYPSVTGDGSIISWVVSQGCGSCWGAVPSSSAGFFGIAPEKITIPKYRILFSRNGRYALSPGYLGLISPAVEDLTTGRTWDNTNGGVPFSPSEIAGDGTLLGLKSTGITGALPDLVSPPVVVRWRPDAAAEDVFTAPAIAGFALAADGQRAMIETYDESIRQFWLVDLDTKEPRLVAEFGRDPRIPASFPSIVRLNAEGNRALFLWTFGFPGETSQVYCWNPQAGTTAPLDGIPEGAVDAVISYDGSTAWVATETNRLLRFDLDQGTSVEVLGAFPYALTATNHASPVPGSAVQFSGAVPAGTRIHIGDLEFPILATDTPNVTVAQLPWELGSLITAPGFQQLDLLASKEGYPLELPVRNFAATNQLRIQFDTLPPDSWPRYVNAFAGAEGINTDRPARPGETIRVWFTGLGPLDRPVATGAPGPADPPAFALTGIACAIMNQDYSNWTGIPSTPVIYAPGLVGLYQSDLTIPADWPAGVFDLACYRQGTTDRTDALVPVAPAPAQ